jgi:ribulose-phosphate 3-epimerase
VSVIAPCITVETAEDYKASVERLHPFAERVHIDISDGEFSPAFLLSESQIWWPKEWIVDIHAMVARPLEHLPALIALHPHLITFHVETGINLLPIMEQVKAAGIKAGIALLKPTVPSTVSEMILAADHVMIFSGDLGHYGGTASLMQLEKVRLVKAINPSVEIGWDGGVSTDNAYTLTQGGVDVLNAGGAIAKADDPAIAYATLVREINKHGVI